MEYFKIKKSLKKFGLNFNDKIVRAILEIHKNESDSEGGESASSDTPVLSTTPAPINPYIAFSYHTRVEPDPELPFMRLMVESTGEYYNISTDNIPKLLYLYDDNSGFFPCFYKGLDYLGRITYDLLILDRGSGDPIFIGSICFINDPETGNTYVDSYYLKPASDHTIYFSEATSETTWDVDGTPEFTCNILLVPQEDDSYPISTEIDGHEYQTNYKILSFIESEDSESGETVGIAIDGSDKYILRALEEHPYEGEINGQFTSILFHITKYLKNT